MPFVPLAAIPMATSYLVWGAIQIGLLAWLMWRLWSAVAVGWTRQERVALVAVSLAASPLIITFLQGRSRCWPVSPCSRRTWR